MKAHLNLATRDLAESIAFYRTLLQVEPVKVREDYALFITEDPGLELALDLEPMANPSPHDHFGFVVDSSDEVTMAIERLGAARLELDLERDVVCCYAREDKVWATDPDGRRWEIYTVLDELEGVNDSLCCDSTEPEAAARYRTGDSTLSAPVS